MNIYLLLIAGWAAAAASFYFSAPWWLTALSIAGALIASAIAGFFLLTAQM